MEWFHRDHFDCLNVNQIQKLPIDLVQSLTKIPKAFFTEIEKQS